MSSYIADEEFEFLKIERTNGVVFVTIDAPDERHDPLLVSRASEIWGSSIRR